MTKETDELASDYTEASLILAEQTTQVGSGLYQLNDKIDYEENYPNGVIEFLKTDEVKQIADLAGVIPESIQPPIVITDALIDRVNEIFEVDILNLSSVEKTLLSSEIQNIINDIPIPTQDIITTWAENYSKFVAAAAEGSIIIPSKFRTVQIASTDISLDAFIKRTNTRKVVIIGLNKLSYPHITRRFKVPGVLQATLVSATGLTSDDNILFTSLSKEIGAGEVKKGNSVIITNNAQSTDQLKQQKTILDYVDEDSGFIRISNPLPFDLDDTFDVKIHQFSKDQILAHPEFIKIPI
jgi:hypothetical protein